MCSDGGLPSEMQELEMAIHHHQTLYEQVTQAYAEVRLRPRRGEAPPTPAPHFSAARLPIRALLTRLLLMCVS